MLKSRCPWCGKRINRYYDQQNVKKQKTPINLKFAKCSHCHNYYGQNTASKRIKFCFWGICLLILLGIVFKNVYIAFLSIVLIIVAIFSPLEKMDKNENKVIVHSDLDLKITVIYVLKNIKTNNFYFLNNKFDEYDCFSTVSPIYVCDFDKKKNIILGRFIYNHPENIEYMTKEVLNIYDSNMILVAKIKFDD